MARVLLGKVNPSGKLPVTFYRSEEDLPPFDDYHMEGRTYRFFKGKPLFPFGYGLSYTSFEVGNVHRGFENEISLSVKNTGSYDGMGTVLVYVKSDSRPELNKQLAAYRKTFLKKGEEKTLTLELCPEILERIGEDYEIIAEI